MRLKNDRGTAKETVLVEWVYGSTSVEKGGSRLKVKLGVLASELINPSVVLLDKLKEDLKQVIDQIGASPQNFLFDLDKIYFTGEVISILSQLEEGNVTFTVKTENPIVFQYVETMLKIIERGDIKNPITIIEKQSCLYKEDLKDKKVLIVDTHNLFHRAYHAMNLKNSKGEPTSVVYSLINLIREIYRESKHSHIVFASDSPNNWRKAIYPDYKANRGERDESLITQIAKANQLLEKMGFPVFRRDGYEADDIVASAAKTFSDLNAKVFIYSTDKDFNQLISEKIYVFNPMKKTLSRKADIINKFGIESHQFLDYLAIVGDTSDNIPGVKGLGKVGAAKLLQEYGNLDGIYSNLDKIKGATKTKLEASKDLAYTSKKLASMENYLLPHSSISRFTLPRVNPINFVIEDLKELDIKV